MSVTSLDLSLSLGTGRFAGLPAADFTVVISKTADGSVNQTYTATPSVAGTYSYQWFHVGGADILGATLPEYVAQTSDINEVLACRVRKTGRSPAYGYAIGWVLEAPEILWAMTTTTGTTNNGSTNVLFTADGSSIQAAFQGVSSSAYVQRTATVTSTPADLGVMGLFVELDDIPSYQTGTAITLYPAVGGTAYNSPTGVTTRTLSPNLTRGKILHTVRADQITTFGGLGEVAINLRAQVASSGGTAVPYCAAPKLYAVARKVGGVPTYVMTWDDGRASIREWIAPTLASLGLPSTFFVPPDNIGLPGFMTSEQVVELPGFGMEVGINGTRNDTSMTAAANWAELDAGIDYMWAWLAERGLTTDARFLGPYPNGALRVAGTVTNITAATANGTATLTWGTGETAVAGRVVAGFGIPFGTVVDTGGTGSLTLKNATTGLPVTVAAQTKPIAIWDTSSPWYTGELQARLITKGMHLFRQTNSGYTNPRTGFYDQAMLINGHSMSSTGGNGTAAAMNAIADACELNQVMAIAYGHNAVDVIVSGLDTLKTELLPHFQYLASGVQSQRWICPSLSDAYRWYGGASMPGLVF